MAVNWNQYTPQAGASPWTFMTTGPGQQMADPYATALPSGLDVTKQATSTTSDWLKQLQGLWASTNQGRNLYSAYDAPSWGDPAYRKEMAIRRQYLADASGQQARNLAKQATMVGQQRGGYGVRGGPGTAASNLQAAYQAAMGDRASQLQQLYANYIGEREAARQGAISGFQGMLSGIGTGLGAYNTAAGNQAQAAYQAAQNQLAERNMIMNLYMQGLNQPTANQQRMADQMAYLQYQNALQQSMDKQSAAQTLAKYYSGGDYGQYGQGITDASREADAARRAQLEQAMMAMGMLSPVQRKQDMNQILGYGTGNQPSQSTGLNMATGIGQAIGKNANVYYGW